ncbi:MAG: hypothetical protein JWQ40_3275 [Segetibacter sp.]|nr:hypothetical protein [Segetibacter sp.]
MSLPGKAPECSSLNKYTVATISEVKDASVECNSIDFKSQLILGF